MSARWLQGFALVAALLLLNASLTFHNVWPTPAISWRGEISAELAAYIVCCAIVARARKRSNGESISSVALRWIAVVWMFFVIGRYADVTATALFGRDINLYWDLRFIPDVVSLLAKAAHAWLALGVAVAAVLIVATLYSVLRCALGRVATATHVRGERLFVAAFTVLVFFIPGATIARPVTLTYARQIGVAI